MTSPCDHEEACGCYAEGYAQGRANAEFCTHDLVRNILQAGHPSGCECAPCLTAKAVIAEHERRWGVPDVEQSADVPSYSIPRIMVSLTRVAVVRAASIGILQGFTLAVGGLWDEDIVSLNDLIDIDLDGRRSSRIADELVTTPNDGDDAFEVLSTLILQAHQKGLEEGRGLKDNYEVLSG